MNMIDAIKRRFDTWYKYFPIEPDWRTEIDIDFLLELIEVGNREIHFALDLGCGTGRHAEKFRKMNNSIIYAIDFSHSAGSLIKKMNDQKCIFIKDDFFTFLSISDQKYDLVYSFDFTISLYNEQNLETLFGGISRVLNSKFFFVFDIWNVDYQNLEDKLNYCYQLNINEDVVIHSGKIVNDKIFFNTKCTTNEKYNLDEQVQYIFPMTKIEMISKKFGFKINQIKDNEMTRYIVLEKDENNKTS